MPTVRHELRVGPLRLPGTLSLPERAGALVLFAHGSGSSRHSPRNVQVAEGLNGRGIATLLFDLLQPEEGDDRRKIFDIPLLARRLIGVAEAMAGQPAVAALPIGLFGASTGAAAALVAAAALGARVGAVVSRGGRPDLAGEALATVTAPTLLIVGGADDVVIELNRWACERLGGLTALEIVPGATHLFPEPGALETVTDLAANWFVRHLIQWPRRQTTASRP